MTGIGKVKKFKSYTKFLSKQIDPPIEWRNNEISVDDQEHAPAFLYFQSKRYVIKL